MEARLKTTTVKSHKGEVQGNQAPGGKELGRLRRAGTGVDSDQQEKRGGIRSTNPVPTRANIRESTPRKLKGFLGVGWAA